MYVLIRRFYKGIVDRMSNNTQYINNSNKISDVSNRNLAKVLIQFMNLQNKEVRDRISNELCSTVDRLVCNYTRKVPYYYITDGIEHGKLTFNTFLRTMEQIKNEMRHTNKTFSFKGFTDVVKNYKTLPENSDERKQMKYKGMINCCIVSGDCSDSRQMRNTFLGIPISRSKSPKMCIIGGRTRKRRSCMKKTHRRRR